MRKKAESRQKISKYFQIFPKLSYVFQKVSYVFPKLSAVFPKNFEDLDAFFNAGTKKNEKPFVHFVRLAFGRARPRQGRVFSAISAVNCYGKKHMTCWLMTSPAIWAGVFVRSITLITSAYFALSGHIAAS